MFIYSIIRTLFHAQPVVFCFPWIVILVAGVLGCHHFCWWKWHRRNRKVNANNVASGSSKTGFQCMFLCSIYLLLKVFGHANFAAVFCPSHRCLLFFFLCIWFLMAWFLRTYMILIWTWKKSYAVFCPSHWVFMQLDAISHFRLLHPNPQQMS